MSFELITKLYLDELKDDLEIASATGSFTDELSYRTTLDNYFAQIIDSLEGEIHKVLEPNNQGRAGRPDWRFSDANTLGVYGYVEAKGIDLQYTINPNDHLEQVQKYLNLGHKVILTDGIDFVFYSRDGDAETISLVTKPVTAENLPQEEINLRLDNKFRDFFEQAQARHCNEQELVQEVAKRAYSISDGVKDLIGIPQEEAIDETERDAIAALRELKEILENHHDPVLSSNSSFADFVAQVLTFGLLYAHRIVGAEEEDDPIERYNKINAFWTQTVYRDYSEKLKPFKALIEILGDELSRDRLGEIGTWYDDCRLLLAYITLEEQQQSQPDYHILYERYLSVFDPQTRFDYGAFYTPPELAYFTVGLTKSIIDQEFHGRSIYEAENKLIDPCCGTGTFLEQLINQGPETLSAKIVGFEILPAPYALAHYRISMLEKDLNTDSISIVLTNTLNDEIEKEVDKDEEPENLVQEEQINARHLAKPPLMLVIANPPSTELSNRPSRTTGPRFSKINELLEDFRPPHELRKNRGNLQKQIGNDFMKFLRWTTNKILESGYGAFAMVLPSSFAEHGSYQYARAWIMRKFTKIWALDLDEDSRRGIGAFSLFNTLQGRMLLIGINNPNGRNDHKINYASITGNHRTEKLQILKKERRNDQYLRLFDEHEVDNQTFDFRPAKSFDEEIWANFWAISREDGGGKGDYIFNRNVSGVKLAPTHMFVHIDENILRRRSREISRERYSIQDLQTKWYDGMRRPPDDEKFTPDVRELIGIALGRDSIQNYAYRPFLTTKVLADSEVLDELQSTGGGGTRSRPELMEAFQDDDTIGIALTPGPKDVGGSLHRFASFCWNLPDNDLCKRGSTRVFCNQFPEYKTSGGEWNRDLQVNINTELADALSNSFGREVQINEIVYYAYSILCSNKFLDEFEGALFTVSGPKKQPRIPITTNALLFEFLALKGRKLALLEKNDEAYPLSDTWSSYEDLFTGPFQLHSSKWREYDEESNTYTILLGSRKETNIQLPSISDRIVEFEVSGYNVINQWLKMYSYKYKRVDFTENDYKDFLDLLNRIETQLDIIEEIDQNIDPLINGGANLITP